MCGECVLIVYQYIYDFGAVGGIQQTLFHQTEFFLFDAFILIFVYKDLKRGISFTIKGIADCAESLRFDLRVHAKGSIHLKKC